MESGPNKYILAFPQQSSEISGMTLRDYFAAKALVGLLDGVNSADQETIAKLAYIIADAMLKARAL